MLRYLLIGKLQRDYIITPDQKAHIDIPGGNLLYAAVGFSHWETDAGLVARVGEDFPQEWLEEIARLGLDTRGIHILPETIDVRNFVAYQDLETPSKDTPISSFARIGLPMPKSLLGYASQAPKLDSKTQPDPTTIRIRDIPEDYLDTIAAHICPLNYQSHVLLPNLLRQGRITTLTLDPAAGYMDPLFWDDIPVLFKDLTALLVSEQKVRSLFQGRSGDLWEMAETLAGYGCEIVVIKCGARGQYVYDHHRHAHWVVPAYPVRATDPTGAGDAFCGGFLAGYQKSYNPLEAALYGSVSASLAVEGTGPFYALDTLEGLPQARLEMLTSMVREA